MYIQLHNYMPRMTHSLQPLNDHSLLKVSIYTCTSSTHTPHTPHSSHPPTQCRTASSRWSHAQYGYQTLCLRSVWSALPNSRRFNGSTIVVGVGVLCARLVPLIVCPSSPEKGVWSLGAEREEGNWRGRVESASRKWQPCTIEVCIQVYNYLLSYGFFVIHLSCIISLLHDV